MLRHLAIALCLATVAHAAQVPRPLKTCGTRLYGEEVALGCGTILADELDGDFTAIFGEFNGNISDANIAPVGTANIDCGKLAAGTCPGSVITAGAICSTQIGNDCILNADINSAAAIAGSKLAAGAALTQNVTATATASSSQVTGTGEVTLVTLPAMAVTRTGAFVVIAGNVGATLCLPQTNPVGSIIWRYKRTGTTIRTIQQNYQGSSLMPASVCVPVTVPPFVLEAPPAAAHVYTLTAQVGGDGTLTTSVSPGNMWAIELR